MLPWTQNAVPIMSAAMTPVAWSSWIQKHSRSLAKGITWAVSAAFAERTLGTIERSTLTVGVSLLLVLYGAIQLAGMFGSDRGADRPAPTSGQMPQPESTLFG